MAADCERTKYSCTDAAQHPFIAQAENPAAMQKVFEAIFLNNTLNNLGAGF